MGNPGNLNLTIQDPSTLTGLDTFEDKVQLGHLGKIATFWPIVIDHAQLIQLLPYSIKTKNFTPFHKCSGDMADLFFAYVGPNYSR